MRLIDADELKHDFEWLEGDTPVYLDVMSTIDERTTVDAVEVVRCKDCVHHSRTGWCYRLGVNDEDGFCNYGARREEDGTTVN